MLSNDAPSGTLASGTTNTTLSLTTHEVATCRYSTTAGMTYSSMPNTFSTTGGTSHSTTVTGLSNGNSYTYYVRCQDGAGNASTTDYPVSFSVAAPSGGGGLISHYTFDNTANDSAGSNHGTIQGGPTYTTGKLNQALNFDGVDDWVSIPHATALNPSIALTIATWFNPDTLDTTTSGGDHFVVKGDWNLEDSFSLVLYNSALRCNVGRTWSGGLQYSVSNFTPGTWYHVACLADSSGHKLYVNGALVASNTTAAQAVTTTQALRIGRLNSSNGHFDGLIDDVRIYNTVLSQTQVQELYNLGATTPAPTVSLSAAPSSITSGESSTLTWSSTNATSCTASGGWSGTKATAGSQSVSPTNTTTYTLSCTGAGGSSQQSATVTISASSDTLPMVSIFKPANGATVSGSVTIETNASDDNGVTQVEFFVDGVSIGIDANPAYQKIWDSTTVANGSHTLTARATDTIGQTTTSPGVTVTVSNSTTPPPAGEVLAFPSAEGFGRNALGGRGGYVCHVDTLTTAETGNQIAGTPHHRGSFRYCFYRPGPVTIVFDISGVYADTFTAGSSRPALAYRTYAGQTAPHQGFVLKGVQLQYSGHTIIRHMVVLGILNNPSPSSWGSIEGTSNPSNSIIDHSTMAYATDDTFGWHGGSDITYQWNIIANGLLSSCSGCSGYTKSGLLGGSGANRGSLLYNLLANNANRNPWTQTGNHQMINNIVYNARDVSYFADVYGTIHLDIVGNYLKRGPSTGSGTYDNAYNRCSSCKTGDESPNSSLYFFNNFHTTLRPTGTESEAAIYFNRAPGYQIVTTPHHPAPPSQMTSSEAYAEVLARSGARVPVVPAVNQEVVNNVKNFTGQVHSNITNYPSITPQSRPAGYDSDYDGMPNTWEQSCGLNPSNSLDGAQTAPNGYTNLENFLNKLAGDTIPLGDCGGLGGSTPSSATSIKTARSTPWTGAS